VDHAVSFNRSQQKSVAHLQQLHTQLCAQRQPPLRFPPNPSGPFTALGPTVKLIQRLQHHNRQTKAFRQSSEPRCLGIHRLPNLPVAWVRLVAFTPFRGTSRWRTAGYHQPVITKGRTSSLTDLDIVGAPTRHIPRSLARNT
jgi:hypothetical protein